MEHFLTVLLMRLIYRSVSPTATKVGGSMLLSYGKLFKVFVIVIWCILIAAFLAAAVWPPRGRNLNSALFLGVMFTFLNGALTLEVWGVSIVYDECGIVTHSPWRFSRSVNWNEVTRVQYSYACQWYLINTAKKGYIRCPIFLDGTASLLDELRKRGLEIPEWQHHPII